MIRLRSVLSLSRYKKCPRMILVSVSIAYNIFWLKIVAVPYFVQIG